jgi:hypothetical protein
VRLQVHQQAAAALARGLLAPARLGDWAPALVARLVADHLAEDAGREHGARREVLGVPPPVLEDGEHHAARRGQLGQLPALGGGRRQRLVDDDRELASQRVPCLGGVRRRRRRDDDEVEVVGVGPELVEGRHDADVGVLRPGGGGTLRVAGHHVRELQPVDLAQQRRVELATGHAVPDERDTDVLHPRESGEPAFRAQRRVVPADVGSPL